MEQFRLATFGDIPLLHAWRCDPVTAASSRRGALPLDVFEAEITARLSGKEPKLFVYEKPRGTPVGTFHIEGTEVSYTVAPEHRRKGHATAMLTKAMEWFGPLDAEIKRGNVASIRAAEKTGHRVHLID